MFDTTYNFSLKRRTNKTLGESLSLWKVVESLLLSVLKAKSFHIERQMPDGSNRDE